jgi:hypothetical protein
VLFYSADILYRYNFILSPVEVLPYKLDLNDARTATCASFLRWFPRPNPASTSPDLVLNPPETLPKIYVLKPVMYNLDRQLYLKKMKLYGKGLCQEIDLVFFLL